jgi:hypothetical protein
MAAAAAGNIKHIASRQGFQVIDQLEIKTAASFHPVQNIICDKMVN